MEREREAKRGGKDIEGKRERMQRKEKGREGRREAIRNFSTTTNCPPTAVYK